MKAKKEINDAFRRIVILTNYRERCEQELRERLVSREKFSEEVFEAALEKAKKYDIVNNERYAQLYSFSKIQSSRGVNGVKRHLSSMKIDYEDMPSVVEILNEAQTKEYHTALDYLKRHPSRSKDAFSGGVRKLVSRGFSNSIAIKVAKEWMQDFAV